MSERVENRKLNQNPNENDMVRIYNENEEKRLRINKQKKKVGVEQWQDRRTTDTLQKRESIFKFYGSLNEPSNTPVFNLQLRAACTS